MRRGTRTRRIVTGERQRMDVKERGRTRTRTRTRV